MQATTKEETTVTDAVASVEESTESFLMQKIVALEEKVEALEEQQDTAVAQRDRRIKDLERRLSQVEDRTDMLQLVKNADDLEGEQRSAALLQHLQRKAEKKDGRGGKKSATLTKPQAEETLHHPNIDRTTYYADMERVERWVGDTDVCEYTDGELVLDLEAGDIGTIYNGGD